MQIRVSNYYNEKTQDFQSKKILDEVEVLALQVTHLIQFIDSVVRVVSRIHQSLNTLIYFAFLSLSYVVCLYLWLIGRK